MSQKPAAILPDIEKLAKLYRDAVTRKDSNAAAIGEAAVHKLAAAEASIAEATILTKFLESGSGA